MAVSTAYTKLLAKLKTGKDIPITTNVKLEGDIVLNDEQVLIFKNGAKFTGTGTVIGGQIECNYRRLCIDEGVSVKNLLNKVVSVMWFGAKGDFLLGHPYTQPKTDNLNAFNKALSAVEDTSIGGYQTAAAVYMPAPRAGSAYYLSNTFFIDRGVQWFGDNIDRCNCIFPPGVPGFETVYAGNGTGASKIHFRDFTLIGNVQGYGAGLYDNKSHGFSIRTNMGTYERVRALRFNGDGFNVGGNVPQANANNNTFIDIVSNLNSGNGLRYWGGDSNNNRILGGDFYANAQFAVRDWSVGNTGVGIHTAANGTENIWQRGSVSYKGKRYFTTIDNNVGITPGTSEAWVYFGDGPVDAVSWKEWQATEVYNMGGSFYGEYAGMSGAYLNCYAEGDQWFGKDLGQNLIIGGSWANMKSQTIIRGNSGIEVKVLHSVGKGLKTSLTGAGVRLQHTDGNGNPSGSDFGIGYSEHDKTYTLFNNNNPRNAHLMFPTSKTVMNGDYMHTVIIPEALSKDNMPEI